MGIFSKITIEEYLNQEAKADYKSIKLYSAQEKNNHQ